MRHNRFEDLTGRVYGQRTVLSYSGQSSNGTYEWNVQCSCGSEAVVQGNKLKRGLATKCHRCSGKANGRIGLNSQARSKPCYFIRTGDYVKIGSSNDPERRLKDLESSNPHPLSIEYIDEDEVFWHRVFEHKHHRGEWFYFPVVKS